MPAAISITAKQGGNGMTAMAGLGRLWNSIQTWLLPMLEDELGELNVALTIHAVNFQIPPNLQALQPLHGDLSKRYLLERLAEVSP